MISIHLNISESTHQCLKYTEASQSDGRSYKALDAWIKTIAGCRSFCGAAVVMCGVAD